MGVGEWNEGGGDFHRELGAEGGWGAKEVAISILCTTIMRAVLFDKRSGRQISVVFIFDWPC